MSTATKNHTEKTAEQAAKPAEAKNVPVQKASGDIFAKIKEVSGTSGKKVDEWQKTWLAMPETRKKYEHLTDAPEVVGEELLAITNDVINFVQKQEGGQSVVFKKIKAGLGKLFKTPLEHFKALYKKNQEKTTALAEKAKTQGEAKVKAATEKAKDVKAQSESKVKATAEKAKKAVDKPTKK